MTKNTDDFFSENKAAQVDEPQFFLSFPRRRESICIQRMNFIQKIKPLKWTSHAKMKMAYYRLSEGRVRRVLHSPRRTEEGIAENTIALMQPASMTKTTKGAEDWNQELWVMIVETPNERRVISAWRYPGKTKPGDPIPQEILNELTL